MPSKKAVRLDIQAVRALAVALVVGNHLVGLPSGGFVGVDVFFVVSGFLITEGLLREHAVSGRLALTAFYARRARRILPAALVTLAVTSVAAWLVFREPQAVKVTLGTLASLFFAENWHLVGSAAQYFDQGAASTPLEHFWSLAVEEQFYAFWPIALVALSLAAPVLARVAPARLRPSFRQLVVAAALIGIILSASYAAWRTESNPSGAYFDTFARAWELAVGAALAVAAPRLRRAPRRVGPLLAGLGLGLVVASAVLVTPETPFPWPGAVAPITGTGLVVAFGTSDLVARAPRVVRSPVLALGAASFSLYLWHLPVAVFLRALSDDAAWSPALAVAVSLALAALSYRFVEQPFRHPRVVREGARGAVGKGAASRALPRWATLGLPALVTVVIVVAAGAEWKGPAVLRETQAAAEVLRLDDRDAGVGQQVPPVTDTAEAVRRGLGLASWNTLTPAVDDLYASALAPAFHDCLYGPGTPDDQAVPCRWGDAEASRTALVVGDSVAMSWTPALTAALIPAGWRVVAVGYTNCSPIEAEVDVRGAGWSAGCARARDRFDRLADDLRPDLVVASGREQAFSSLTSGATGPAAIAEWQAGAEKTIASLGRSGAHVALLSNPPVSTAPLGCATRFNGPVDCTSTLSTAYRGKVRAETAAAANARAGGREAIGIDTESWFCADARCPVAVGTFLARVDSTHLTGALGEGLGAPMAAALAPALRFDAPELGD